MYLFYFFTRPETETTQELELRQCGFRSPHPKTLCCSSRNPLPPSSQGKLKPLRCKKIEKRVFPQSDVPPAEWLNVSFVNSIPKQETDYFLTFTEAGIQTYHALHAWRFIEIWLQKMKGNMHCILSSFTKSQSRQSFMNDSIYAYHERKHATFQLSLLIRHG